MKLRDVFEYDKHYVLSFSINDKYYLFIEGLTENGCVINSEDFDINNIKNICIELFEIENGYGDYVDTISTTNITLDTKIGSIIEKTIKEMGL